MNRNPLTRAGIKKKVVEIISEFVEQDGLIVNEEEMHILDIDSLIAMDIILEIEREFNIRITDPEILSMETFDQMMAVIYGKLEGV
ncbi:MAG: acyl carrier protein [Proteobacteria bacterium]|nr:acyl carrier protein [Pseudomonadota bacterium]